jgi:HPt (histidine-containing phosphotransfer) domain-containing protein
MGRAELYGRIAARYIESRQSDPQVLRDALGRSDWSRIAAIAHVSTSSAGTLGAELLSLISRELEVAADDQDSPQNIQNLVDQFSTEHERVMTELQAFTARPATRTEAKVSQ